MDFKDRLYDNATKNFDICIEKYGQKVKNILYGMIFHAYNKGKREGEKTHDEQAFNIGTETMLDAIRHFSLSQKVLFTAFTSEEIESVFPDCGTMDFLLKDAKEIIEKAEEIRENRNNNIAKLTIAPDQIEIGDEVQDPQTGAIFVVTDLDETCCIGGIASDGTVRFYEMTPDDVNYPVKTGRHIDVKPFLNQIHYRLDI